MTSCGLARRRGASRATSSNLPELRGALRGLAELPRYLAAPSGAFRSLARPLVGPRATGRRFAADSTGRFKNLSCASEHQCVLLGGIFAPVPLPKSTRDGQTSPKFGRNHASCSHKLGQTGRVRARVCHSPKEVDKVAPTWLTSLKSTDFGSNRCA